MGPVLSWKIVLVSFRTIDLGLDFCLEKIFTFFLLKIGFFLYIYDNSRLKHIFGFFQLQLFDCRQHVRCLHKVPKSLRYSPNYRPWKQSAETWYETVLSLNIWAHILVRSLFIGYIIFPDIQSCSPWARCRRNSLLDLIKKFACIERVQYYRIDICSRSSDQSDPGRRAAWPTRQKYTTSSAFADDFLRPILS